MRGECKCPRSSEERLALAVVILGVIVLVITLLYIGMDIHGATLAGMVSGRTRSTP